MNLNVLSKALVGVFLFLTLAAGSCENQDFRFVLEKMPKEYRACASKVVTIPDGPLTYRQLINLTAQLRRSELHQNACLKGAIKWADAQYKAYYQQY